jgi:hypothetical protein
MRHLLRVLSRITVAILLTVPISGCSPPPSPSAETAALESSLLSLSDVNGGFEEEDRGQVGVSGGKLCPDSDFAFQDVGAVRAAFEWPTGDDEQVELVEMLHVVESNRIAVLMADLEAALASCDGIEWTDYGETKSFTVMDMPAIGDNSLAVQSPANPPSEGSFDYRRTIYVARGNVFVEITISESLEGASDDAMVSNDEMHRIATAAVSKLPN